MGSSRRDEPCPGQDRPELAGRADASVGRIETTASDAWHASVALQGEIDAAVAPVLRSEVGRHLDAGRRLIRVDARAVTFIDSLGLAALASAAERCVGAHASLILTNVPARMQRIIQITGLDSMLLIDTARDEHKPNR
ncbi:MAG TPA: STAS domain-containing protein [Mycobacterium sp.]|jgi:anti-sigma B factor antagonist|nr:STAS domain-containing protein [Mycobacterium sp.]